MAPNSAPYASFEERQESIARVAKWIPRDVSVVDPLLAQVQLLDDEVSDLQKLAMGFITHSLGIPPETEAAEVLQRLEGQPFQAARKAHQWLIPLERSICGMLRTMQVDRSALALEYPINVRVVHGTPFPDYDKRTYPTTSVHTDIWAGEPADTLQALIPLMGNVQDNFCQWYEADRERFDICLSNSADYRSAREKLGDVRAIAHTFDIGKLYFFDGALPHQTIQKGKGIRISLDFRLRRLFPYADPNWMQRMRRDKGAYDRYYLLPPHPYPFTTFREKLDHEIEVLEALGFSAFAGLRREEYDDV